MKAGSGSGPCAACGLARAKHSRVQGSSFGEKRLFNSNEMVTALQPEILPIHETARSSPSFPKLSPTAA